jgi:hypothetical protein
VFAGVCRRADDAARIVVAHHHFAPAPDYLHDWTMPKAKRAMERFVELRVELILGVACTARSSATRWTSPGTPARRGCAGLDDDRTPFALRAPGFVPMSRHQFRRPGRLFMDLPRG